MSQLATGQGSSTPKRPPSRAHTQSGRQFSLAPHVFFAYISRTYFVGKDYVFFSFNIVDKYCGFRARVSSVSCMRETEGGVLVHLLQSASTAAKNHNLNRACTARNYFFLEVAAFV